MTEKDRLDKLEHIAERLTTAGKLAATALGETIATGKEVLNRVHAIESAMGEMRISWDVHEKRLLALETEKVTATVTTSWVCEYMSEVIPRCGDAAWFKVLRFKEAGHRLSCSCHLASMVGVGATVQELPHGGPP